MTMKQSLTLLGIFLCCATLCAGKRVGSELRYVKIDIANAGYEKVMELKSAPGLKWWVELDQTLVALTHEKQVRALRRMASVKVLPVPVREDKLVVVSMGHGFKFDGLYGDLLGSGGRFALLQRYDKSPVDALFKDEQHTHEPGDLGCHTAWQTFEPNKVLARTHENRPVQYASKFRTEVQTLVDSVDPARWQDDVTTLAGFSRQTLTDGVTDAGNWLFEKFSQLPGLEVRRRHFPVNSGMAFNVEATIRGRVNPDDIYIIGAHYDAIANRDAGATAPGAEDNGSGTAGVLEMARIFSAFPPNATYIFICFSGEEQNLWGSRDHAARLIASGDNVNVKAVCNMDMIGYTSDNDLDVLLETGNPGLFTLDIWGTAAADYTSLRTVTSTDPFGSDHVPYLIENMPALLTIQNEWASYPGYHRSTDTAEKVSMDMGSEIIRMNVAALAGMSGFQGFDNPVWVFNTQTGKFE